MEDNYIKPIGETLQDKISWLQKELFKEKERNENSIPISLIQKKKEELKNVLDIIKTGKNDFSKGQASVLERIIKMLDKELLDERSNTNV